MFTGIVEGLATVKALRGPRLTLAVAENGFRLGDSVAVNGVCLTVVKKGRGGLDFDVSPETFQRTDLGSLKSRSRVNIERPLTPQAAVGGHWVTGHVDAVVRLLEKQGGDFVRLRFSLPRELARFVALKGSVALDGVSLTVTRVGPTVAGDSWAETVLVPHTLEKTTLGLKGPGDALNLEVDLLARYVQRLLESK